MLYVVIIAFIGIFVSIFFVLGRIGGLLHWFALGPLLQVVCS